MKSLPSTLLLVILFFATGCVRICKTGCCTIRPDVKICGCCDGRRPQIMTSYKPYVYDFDTSQCKDGNCRECFSCLHKDASCGCKTSGCPYCRCDDGLCKECGERACICGRAPLGELPEKNSPFIPHVKNYRVSAGDIFEIEVFGHPDTLVELVPVAPDGKIYYLFLNGFSVQGMTLDKVREELETRLKEYFLEPKVSIIPIAIGNQNVMVLGRVKTPGLYPLLAPTTVRQALAIAGGLAEETVQSTPLQGSLSTVAVVTGRDFQHTLINLRDSFLVRDGKRLPIDFERLIRTADAEQDIFLRPGDYIYIAAFDYKEIYVIGAVQSQMIPYQGGLTLVQTLGSLPGLTNPTPYTGEYSEILVIRGNLKCPCVMRVDYRMILSGEARDIYLQPGDIVYIPHKKFRFGRALVRMAIQTFVNIFVNNITQQAINESNIF